jgi:phospholipid/cholesterol/gamma-HCH transport system permease protein
MARDSVLRALCRGLIGHLDQTAGLFALLGRALRNAGALASPPVRSVFYRQVYFTGIQALWRSGLLGAMIGIVVLTQVASLVGKNAALGGRILVWVVIRELGPLFAAIVVISRSSSAIAAELAAMRVNREMEFLRGLGVSPLRYLIVPRVTAVAAARALTVWFEAATIVGGLVFSSLIVQLPFSRKPRPSSEP